MSKNLKSLICCILALLFVSGTVIAVFADSNDLFKGTEAVSVTEDASNVDEEASEVETSDADVDNDAEEETSDADVDYRLGDVNFDGKITAADARLALRFSAQLETPTTAEFIVSDVITNGKLEANDARLILRVSARLAAESDFGAAAPEVESDSNVA